MSRPLPKKIQDIVEFAEARNLVVEVRINDEYLDGVNGPVEWTMVFLTVANDTRERFGENGLNDGWLDLVFVVHGNRVKFRGGWTRQILLKRRRVWKYRDVYQAIRFMWLPPEHRTVPAFE